MAKPERQHNFVDAGAVQHLQMAFKQAGTVKLQQALRHLLSFGLLQTQAASGGKNNGSHGYPVKKIKKSGR